MPIKVCLISIHDTTHAFGVRSISAFLRKGGHKVSIVFFRDTFENYTPPTSEELTELIELLKTLKPDIVGISLTTPILKIAVELTKHIKKLGIPVIWGGKHPTICPEDSIQYADIICIGEGEEAMLELANATEMGDDITSIQNLWLKRRGEIIKNDIRPFQENLDSLPFFDYNSPEYHVACQKITASTRTVCHTMTSRGCPYNCSFCCNHFLRTVQKGRFVRRRSVENVIQELIQAKEMFRNLRKVNFMDDIFTLDPVWVEKFCMEYKRHVNLPFCIIVHPNTVNLEQMCMLKDTGLVLVVMGIQSGSERIRNNIFHRHETNRQIIRAAKIFRELDLRVFFDVIVENPYEVEEDKREAIRLLLSIRPFRLALFPLTYFPKTNLTERALKDSFISHSDIAGTELCSWILFKKDPTKVHLPTKNRDFNIFWNAIFELTTVDFVPSIIIHAFSNSKFLRHHPMLFHRIVWLLVRVHFALPHIKYESF